MKITCGIDWAEKHHDIALVDQNGALVAKRRIAETVEGSNELLTMLAEAGDTAEDPIPVAIETPRGLLVAALRATGRPGLSDQPDGRCPLPGTILSVWEEVRWSARGFVESPRPVESRGLLIAGSLT